MANLSVKTPTQNDTLRKDIQVRIGGKKVWGETILINNLDEDGHPANNLQVRFDEKADGDDLFDFIKDKIVKVPVLKGTVSKHVCYHDEQSNIPCMVWGTYIKE